MFAKRDPHATAHHDASQRTSWALPMRIASADHSYIDERPNAPPPLNPQTTASQVRLVHHIRRVVSRGSSGREPMAVLGEDSESAGAKETRLHAHLRGCQRGTTGSEATASGHQPDICSLSGCQSGSSQQRDR